MRQEVATILDELKLDEDGVYSSGLHPAASQGDEIRQREQVARRTYSDPLREIALHHSIPVMDSEVRRFLRGIPSEGVVADIGGGWGWHWRHLAVERPDVCVIVVDFVRENLRQAVRLLDEVVNRQIYLVHGDATALPFPSQVFDGYWSVQALQHIPNFEEAVREAHRVLRPNGAFVCYSLNRSRLVELVYRLMGRSYHVRGKRPDSFWLARGSAEEAQTVANVFGSSVTSRYTEVLFHPDLRLHTGAASSWIGCVDASLATDTSVFAWVARQLSYHTRKPSAADHSRRDAAVQV